MGEIILLLIVVVLAIKGDYTLFYIFGGVFVIAVIVSLFSKGSAPKKTSARPRLRIDHPHYITDDEYECGICGVRFDRPLTACPQCGVRFNGSRTDDDEYDEELDDELDMDEWGE